MNYDCSEPCNAIYFFSTRGCVNDVLIMAIPSSKVYAHSYILRLSRGLLPRGLAAGNRELRTLRKELFSPRFQSRIFF